MLKHYPKLRKLWNKAPKIGKRSIITLDRRYKATKEFEKELCRVIMLPFAKDPDKLRKAQKLIDYILKEAN